MAVLLQAFKKAVDGGSSASIPLRSSYPPLRTLSYCNPSESCNIFFVSLDMIDENRELFKFALNTENPKSAGLN